MKYIFPGPSFEGLNFVMGFFDTTFSYGNQVNCFAFWSDLANVYCIWKMQFIWM